MIFFFILFFIMVLIIDLSGYNRSITYVLFVNMLQFLQI